MPEACTLSSVWLSRHGRVCVRWLRGTALVGTDAALGSLIPVLGGAVGRLFAAHLSAALGHFVTGIDAIAAPEWDFQDQLVAGLGLVPVVQVKATFSSQALGLST